jgi:hypothetical protein
MCSTNLARSDDRFDPQSPVRFHIVDEVKLRYVLLCIHIGGGTDDQVNTGTVTSQTVDGAVGISHSCESGLDCH